MESGHAFDNIDGSTFNELLTRYPDIVSEKLGALEEQRLDAIPSTLEGRDPPYLTKSELATLMDWKLAHGKFRPQLRSLIQKNAEAFVETVTEEAFKIYASETSKSPAERRDRTKKALDKLTALQGVGPATASLLLSTFRPVEVPFFSDEFYRWCLWEEGKGKGWDREMKYTAKEHSLLLEKVAAFKIRLQNDDTLFVDEEVSALNMEKVAYVLGKQAHESSTVPLKKRKMPTKKDMKERRAAGFKHTEPFVRGLMETLGSKSEEDEDSAEDEPVTSETTRPRRRRKLN